jgi:hypothetical protein
MLVKLGCQLIQIPALQEWTVEQTEPIFDEWFRRSVPHIRTKDRRVSWREWNTIWQWADPELVGDSIAQARLVAQDRPIPAFAMKYRSQKMRELIVLCQVLHEDFADEKGIWFLSCRSAGKVLEMDHSVAADNLRRLVRDGVLELASEHVDGSMKAQRYRYLGDTAQEKAA